MMTTTGKHLFERQGFGPGPYVLVDNYECTTHTIAREQGRDLGFWPAPAQAAGTCDSCGQCIKDVYVLESANGTQFRTGCDCVLKAYSEDLGAPVVREVKRAKRDATARRRRENKARRERIQQRARLKLFVSEAGRELLADLRVDHHIIRDIRRGLIRWGKISEKQTALVAKIAREERERLAAPPEVHVPVPETSERMRIEGTVVSVKGQDTDYGYTLKMTVKVETEAGTYLVWGTAPDALLDYNVDGYGIKGKRVAFMAKVQRSNRDEHFGFFKRPTKPQLLEK